MDISIMDNSEDINTEVTMDSETTKTEAATPAEGETGGTVDNVNSLNNNERMTEEGGNITNADDVVREIEASSTPTKVPDVVHDTEGSDSEDNNNDTKKFSRPSTLETSGSFRRKIRIKNMEELDFKNERFPSVGEADTLSNDNVDLNKTFDPDDIQTPDELDTPDLEALGVTDSDWDDDDDESTTPEGDSDNAVEPIPEYSATEEFQDSRNWRKVTIAEKTFKIDMKVIEPYKKVLSHGGYYGDGLNAIIIFASCYLPDKGRRDYNYVMDNLFLYVISTLELLVAEDYMIVYFHGSTPRTRMPTISWMRRCYQIIDRRLRKNLKGLLLVHPTFWLKTVILMTRPFISTKFSSKVKFIHSLKDLGDTIPMEYVFVPDQVKRTDEEIQKKRQKNSKRGKKTPTGGNVENSEDKPTSLHTIKPTSDRNRMLSLDGNAPRFGKKRSEPTSVQKRASVPW